MSLPIVNPLQRLYRSRSLHKGQGHTKTLHTYTPYQVSTPSTLRFPKYNLDKIFKLKVKGQIKVISWRCTPTSPNQWQGQSRSHHGVAHLQLPTNVPNKYQLPTPYSFRDITQTRFYRSRSPQQGEIKVTPWCCTPTPPNQCLFQVSTSYTLRFLI